MKLANVMLHQPEGGDKLVIGFMFEDVLSKETEGTGVSLSKGMDAGQFLTNLRKYVDATETLFMEKGYISHGTNQS